MCHRAIPAALLTFATVAALVASAFFPLVTITVAESLPIAPNGTRELTFDTTETFSLWKRCDGSDLSGKCDTTEEFGFDQNCTQAKLVLKLAKAANIVAPLFGGIMFGLLAGDATRGVCCFVQPRRRLCGLVPMLLLFFATTVGLAYCAMSLVLATYCGQSAKLGYGITENEPDVTRGKTSVTHGASFFIVACAPILLLVELFVLVLLPGKRIQSGYAAANANLPNQRDLLEDYDQNDDEGEAAGYGATGTAQQQRPGLFRTTTTRDRTGSMDTIGSEAAARGHLTPNYNARLGGGGGGNVQGASGGGGGRAAAAAITTVYRDTGESFEAEPVNEALLKP